MRIIRRRLHEDRPGNTSVAREVDVVVVSKCPPCQRRNIVRPRVRPLLRIDQMLMRVEHGDEIAHDKNSSAIRALSSPRSGEPFSLVNRWPSMRIGQRVVWMLVPLLRRIVWSI